MWQAGAQNMNEEFLRKVLELSIKQWNRTFGGTSALDICEKLSTANEIVMKAMETLRDQGKGTINANVELFVIEFDTEKPKMVVPTKATITHVFFPNKEILADFFYSSSLVRENYPEYKNRLHCGAHQLELAMFSDEVLTRYFDHPELYKIDDSLSGGHIWAKSEAPENRYLYVRHGKRKLKSGRTAVTAIYKDLYAMSDEEQRHWHAYEISGEDVERHDPNFARFMARTYEGAFVEFPNPIKDVVTTLENINTAFKKGGLFKRINNSHFRPPVENTEKAYYDCCSEFYKLIGPDSLNQQAIKAMLSDTFALSDSNFLYAESERPLSSLQLLSLLEEKLGSSGVLTGIIKRIGKDRIEADHKITNPAVEDCNFVENFVIACEDFISAGNFFERRIYKNKIT